MATVRSGTARAGTIRARRVTCAAWPLQSAQATHVARWRSRSATGIPGASPSSRAEIASRKPAHRLPRSSTLNALDLSTPWIAQRFVVAAGSRRAVASITALRRAPQPSRPHRRRSIRVAEDSSVVAAAASGGADEVESAPADEPVAAQWRPERSAPSSSGRAARKRRGPPAPAVRRRLRRRGRPGLAHQEEAERAHRHGSRRVAPGQWNSQSRFNGRPRRPWSSRPRQHGNSTAVAGQQPRTMPRGRPERGGDPVLARPTGSRVRLPARAWASFTEASPTSAVTLQELLGCLDGASPSRPRTELPWQRPRAATPRRARPANCHLAQAGTPSA
ncbi:hypothetical protein SAMN06273567_1075 [Geodermatophilus aquaeductus]|uniref:Uncharacterized protein n=1 Tax=Geodermatophilus aquaeductus TaxID=1564161 RepID=A0A521F4I1_9ACTN|nr:hypothetical protein SAMN06273567_1075 [Geodermatophilus aquaeductus]